MIDVSSQKTNSVQIESAHTRPSIDAENADSVAANRAVPGEDAVKYPAEYTNTRVPIPATMRPSSEESASRRNAMNRSRPATHST